MPVLEIGAFAFSGCTGLTSVTIPGSITRIGLGTFSGCTGLTSMTIPGSITRIDSGTFLGCTGLINVTIPNSVTSIGGGNILGIPLGAFYGCTGLTSVTIPDSVTSIEDEVFSHCNNLKSAYFNGDAPLMGFGVFSYCATTFTVYYIAGSTGFTSPSWQGYPSKTFNPACAATQVLGEDNPVLEQLRNFRDSSLAQNIIGRRIIQIYYNNADSINAALERSPALREAARRVLEVIAPMVGKK